MKLIFHYFKLLEKVKKVERDLLSLESLASSDTGFFMKESIEVQSDVSILNLHAESSLPIFDDNSKAGIFNNHNFSFSYLPENIPSSLIEFKKDWTSIKMLDTEILNPSPNFFCKSFNESSDITQDAYNTLKQILPLAYPSKNTPFQVDPTPITIINEFQYPSIAQTTHDSNFFSQIKISEFTILALQGIPSQIFELSNFTLKLSKVVNFNENVSILKNAAKIGTLFLHIKHFSTLYSCGILENVKEKLKKYCMVYLKWFQNIDLISSSPEEDLVWKRDAGDKSVNRISKNKEPESIFAPLNHRFKCSSVVGIFSLCESIFSELTFVFQLCKDIQNMEGHEILTYLYSSCSNSKQLIVSYILKYTMVPYFDMMKLWIYKGEIHDPFHEFFIRYEVSNYSYNNHLNFKLVPNYVPSFLKSIANDVFVAGQNVSWMQKDSEIMNCVMPRILGIQLHFIYFFKYLDKIELCFTREAFILWESGVFKLLSDQIVFFLKVYEFFLS